ncbi:hypothetical protein DLJ53_31430 [Acuticoccus sediminis]|uniref:Uncharacterized protein n=1 Tax=Acuticoccus sediminis TaxID=2184697 RepID=A0A8B2NKM1_9HYPH|nr:hypothetical protein [Acuticoccus sediminis]RAH96776.1 hypothetical protein DLJ53_31430 [Acuticoccus sediminis]
MIDAIPMLGPVLTGIEQSALGTAVRMTPQLYPILESLHILGIGLLVGPAVAVDMRLLGLGGRSIPVSTVLRHLLPLCYAGFALAGVSGLMMFSGIALAVGQSAAAPWKLGLILLGALNIAVFHRGIHRSVASWDRAPVPPRRARIAGAASALVWTGVIVAGRYLAYV